jgi:methionyl-tRNA formyltransferase
MNIVYLGSGQFGIDCLNALAKSRHRLQLIVTHSPHPAGRGLKPAPTPAGSWAKENSLPVFETDDVNSPGAFEKIKAVSPDLIVVIAFSQKVAASLTQLPSKGSINVHSSLLPKYRGAAPINWAIINGEKETGVSIITLADKLDSGEIIAQAKTPINPDENASQLSDRLSLIAALLLLETIDSIESGKAVYAQQDNSLATKAPKLKKSDGFIDFNEPAQILRRKILGLYPWPGAHATYTSKKIGKTETVIFIDAQITESHNPEKLPAGTIDKNLNVICDKDALKIIQIKPAAGRIMPFKAFANGRQTHPGDIFSKIQK